MTDCGAMNDCAIPMWFQYVVLIAGMALLALKCLSKKDPYDRW